MTPEGQTIREALSARTDDRFFDQRRDEAREALAVLEGQLAEKDARILDLEIITDAPRTEDVRRIYELEGRLAEATEALRENAYEFQVLETAFRDRGYHGLASSARACALRAKAAAVGFDIKAGRYDYAGMREALREAAPDSDSELCGSFGCILPAGHNRGRPDLPEYHQTGEALRAEPAKEEHEPPEDWPYARQQ